MQRIWDAHYLQPHRLRTFKRSSDPDFTEKVEDIVGLYMDPPMHTVVLSIDGKEPNPGARPHPAWATAQAGQMRHGDPRL